MNDNPQYPNIFSVERGHDYEQDCQILKQQIAMYVAQWRQAKSRESEASISDTYTATAMVGRAPTVIGITSEHQGHVSLTIDGNEMPIESGAPQDAAEYSRLYDLMQYMQTCVDLEFEKQA